jgi:hypothetical protein
MSYSVQSGNKSAGEVAVIVNQLVDQLSVDDKRHSFSAGRKKKKEEGTEVTEQGNYNEITSEQRPDIKIINGYQWWGHNYSK